MSKEWFVNGVKAPNWAIAIGQTGRDTDAWIGRDGYNFLTELSDCVEHPFCQSQPKDSFTLVVFHPDYLSPQPVEPVTIPAPRIAAHEFLERGVSHMRDRAVQRDSEAGERSMARAVAAFNAQEGTNLTEAQGWRFMIQLKYARAVNGVFVADDYEDMCGYAGLAGEAAQ